MNLSIFSSSHKVLKSYVHTEREGIEPIALLLLIDHIWQDSATSMLPPRTESVEHATIPAQCA